MNVRITPRGQPQREDLYGGVGHVFSDGVVLWLFDTPLDRDTGLMLRLVDVAAIALDDDPGDLC